MSDQLYEQFTESVLEMIRKEAAEWDSSSHFDPRIYFLTYKDKDVGMIGFPQQVYTDEDKALEALNLHLPDMLAAEQAHTLAFCRIKELCLHNFEHMSDEHVYDPVHSLVVTVINVFNARQYMFPVMRDDSLGEPIERGAALKSKWHEILFRASSQTIAARN